MFFRKKNVKKLCKELMKILKWKPRYTIAKSVQITAEWYKKVLIEKFSVEKITEKQIKDYMNECK